MTKRSTRAGTPTDSVGRVLHIWEREIPDLDLETEGIVERIQKINKHLDHALNETLAEFGIDRGEWWVLTVLRRSGKPYRLSPGALARLMGLSAGAITNRLNNLEEAGLIRRLPDVDDRRGVIVELTEEGWHRWQESVGAQARKEALVASALTVAEKRTLNDLLCRLMLRFEEPKADVR
jgi:DNA-binding MarR family transcriptional regulator